MAIDLFSIGKITVHGYGLMIALGFLFALLFGMWQCKRYELNDDYFFNLALFVLIFGWLGGKVLFCIVEFKTFLSNPIGAIGSEGFVVYGGIISGILTIIIYCKIKKLDMLRHFDIIAAAVPINQGFGRLGCFLAGCCYGRETDSALGVIFPEGCLAPAGVKLLPTQLFSAAGDFLIFALCFIVLQKSKKKGMATVAYLCLYAIGRFIIEFFRNDFRGTVGPFSTSQFISFFILIGGIVLFCILNKQKEEKDETEERRN